MLRTIIQVHEHTGGGLIALKVLLNRQATSTRLAKNIRRNASAIRQKLGQVAVVQLLGNTAKLKAAALRKIDSGTRSIERSYKLVQNGIKQAG